MFSVSIGREHPELGQTYKDGQNYITVNKTDMLQYGKF